MTNLTSVICPVCGAKITVEIEPGEDRVYDPPYEAYPGSSPQVMDVNGCECFDTMHSCKHRLLGGNGWESGVEWYERMVLEEVSR